MLDIIANLLESKALAKNDWQFLYFSLFKAIFLGKANLFTRKNRKINNSNHYDVICQFFFSLCQEYLFIQTDRALHFKGPLINYVTQIWFIFNPLPSTMLICLPLMALPTGTWILIRTINNNNSLVRTPNLFHYFWKPSNFDECFKRKTRCKISQPQIIFFENHCIIALRFLMYILNWKY